MLGQRELESTGHEQRLPVRLSDTSGIGTIGSNDGGWTGEGLAPGAGGEKTLRDWVGWVKGKHFKVENGALVTSGKARL